MCVCVCVWGGGGVEGGGYSHFSCFSPPPSAHTGSCLKCLHTDTPPPKKIIFQFYIKYQRPSLPRGLRPSEQGLNKVGQLYTCRDPEVGQGSGPPDNHKLLCIS